MLQNASSLEKTLPLSRKRSLSRENASPLEKTRPLSGTPYVVRILFASILWVCVQHTLARAPRGPGYALAPDVPGITQLCLTWVYHGLGSTPPVWGSLGGPFWAVVEQFGTAVCPPKMLRNTGFHLLSVFLGPGPPCGRGCRRRVRTLNFLRKLWVWGRFQPGSGGLLI
jgi:hypothetical protein